MRTKTIFNYVVAALFCCCVTGMFTSCKSQDDTGSANNPIAVNKIKQGVWTEYDTALSASGKYTEEELEEMPAVGMMVEGDKAYFFTYSADYRLPCHQGQPCFRPDRQLQDGIRRDDGV